MLACLPYCIYMLSQFEKEESGRLKAAKSTCKRLQEMLESARLRQRELERQMNRCQAIANLIASEQYQQSLDQAASRVQEFQAAHNDYIQLPLSSSSKVEAMQAANFELETKVFDLKREVDQQKEREERIEESFSACEALIDRLISMKDQLNQEIQELKRELDEAAIRKNRALREFQRIQGLKEEEILLLQEGKFDDIILSVTTDIKKANEQHQRTLLLLSERLLILQKLSAQHESAQRLFSSFSSGQSEHDLITEERDLDQQIANAVQAIAEERQAEERALQDCEESVRREAVQQAQQWILRRLEELTNKKTAVRALLAVIPGEAEAGVREIWAELERVEQQESIFRQRLQQDAISL